MVKDLKIIKFDFLTESEQNGTKFSTYGFNFLSIAFDGACDPLANDRDTTKRLYLEFDNQEEYLIRGEHFNIPLSKGGRKIETAKFFNSWDGT